MEVIQITPTGKKIVTLTAEQIAQRAAEGDLRCRQEILKEEVNAATTIAGLKAALIKYLG